MRVINRLAVVVSLRQPFVDWINRVAERNGEEHRVHIESANRESHVYLLEEFDDLEYVRERLEGLKPAILEAELEGWYRVPDLWPKDRSTDVFDQWLAAEIHTVVVDVERGRLKKQDRFP